MTTTRYDFLPTTNVNEVAGGMVQQLNKNGYRANIGINGTGQAVVNITDANGGEAAHIIVHTGKEKHIETNCFQDLAGSTISEVALRFGGKAVEGRN